MEDEAGKVGQSQFKRNLVYVVRNSEREKREAGGGRERENKMSKERGKF